MSGDPTFYAGWVCVGLFLVMQLIAEIGFRLGRRHELPDRTHTELGVVQGALLGTVALLLGFTFSLASARYDARRILLAQETNAIGTTYLRTTLISQDTGDEMRRVLRDYLAQRLNMLRAHDANQSTLASKQVQDLQIALWRLVRKEAARDPRDAMTARLVESLNETIDLESMQRAARAARIPRSVLLLVMAASTLTALALGFGFGVAKRRVPAATVGFSALVCAITFTILDFDRPDRGLIRVSEKMVADLHERVVRAVDRENAGP